MGSEFRKLNHLKSGQMGVILSKTILDPDKNVQISKSGFSNGGDPLKRYLFEIQSLKVGF